MDLWREAITLPALVVSVILSSHMVRAIPNLNSGFQSQPIVISGFGRYSDFGLGPYHPSLTFYDPETMHRAFGMAYSDGPFVGFGSKFFPRNFRGPRPMPFANTVYQRSVPYPRTFGNNFITNHHNRFANVMPMYPKGPSKRKIRISVFEGPLSNIFPHPKIVHHIAKKAKAKLRSVAKAKSFLGNLAGTALRIHRKL